MLVVYELSVQVSRICCKTPHKFPNAVEVTNRGSASRLFRWLSITGVVVYGNRVNPPCLRTIFADHLVLIDKPVVRSSRRVTASPTVPFEVFSVILSANVFNHHPPLRTSTRQLLQDTGIPTPMIILLLPDQAYLHLMKFLR